MAGDDLSKFEPKLAAQPNASPLDPRSARAVGEGEAVDALRKINESDPSAAFGISMALGSPVNPIHQKVTENHITQLLETAKAESDYEFRLREGEQQIGWRQARLDRGFEVVILIAVVGTIVFVVRTFQSQPTIMAPILTGIGGLFTGFLAGIGYGKKGK